MIEKDKVTHAVLRAIDEFNDVQPEDGRIKKTMDVILFGPAAAIDSLQFLTLILAVERSIEETFGKSITLANERAMSQKQSPFRTTGSLTDYVFLLLKESA